MRIVIITAVWCPSCLIMRPRFENVRKSFPDIEFEFYDIDFDEEANNYDVGNVLPVFIILENDIELKRLIGEHKPEVLIKMAEDYFNKKE
ncbi:MAG: thioredoxin family protein [Bacilli bacterium]|nr:thioredoxin family protein [Bacilli bacterium]